MRSCNLKAVLFLCLCFFGSLIVTPVLAQGSFGSVYEQLPVKQTIGIDITTKSGLYSPGCHGQTVSQLTINGPDKDDFEIEDSGNAGKLCGRDTTLTVTIIFTPHGVGPRKAELDYSIIADHPAFQRDFSSIPIPLKGIGVAQPIDWSFFRTVTRLMATTEGALAVPIIFWPSEIGRDEDYLPLNHYTGVDGYIGINKDGYIITGDDNFVYLTPDYYISGKQAQAMLALRNTPIGFFAIPKKNIGGVYYPTRVNKKYFQDGSFQPGGGLEIRVPYDVSIAGSTWIPVSP